MTNRRLHTAQRKHCRGFIAILKQRCSDGPRLDGIAQMSARPMRLNARDVSSCSESVRQ